MNFDYIIEKSLNGEDISNDEIAYLFNIPLFTKESAIIQACGYQKSKKACQQAAEVHAQVGLNIAPCPNDCLFCSFAAVNGIFDKKTEVPLADVIAQAKQFEKDGANAVFVMATADYPFSRFIETSQEIRKNLNPETIMVANVGDFNSEQANKLKQAGFSGIYHAVRLGEGRDTKISPEKRLKTFEFARQAGLVLGTCLEPVGTEHSVEELVEKTIITRDADPCFSGAARRIPIPHTKLAEFGIVSEAKMAHILAVVRLALGYNIAGNCTHEPNVIGAAAGANLLWAEVGSNPRDTVEKTEAARGMNVAQCRKVLEEAEWEVLEGPSKFYAKESVCTSARR
jgi:biotin synthase